MTELTNFDLLQPLLVAVRQRLIETDDRIKLELQSNFEIVVTDHSLDGDNSELDGYTELHLPEGTSPHLVGQRLKVYHGAIAERVVVCAVTKEGIRRSLPSLLQVFLHELAHCIADCELLRQKQKGQKKWQHIEHTGSFYLAYERLIRAAEHAQIIKLQRSQGNPFSQAALRRLDTVAAEAVSLFLLVGDWTTTFLRATVENRPARNVTVTSMNEIGIVPFENPKSNNATLVTQASESESLARVVICSQKGGRHQERLVTVSISSLTIMGLLELAKAKFKQSSFSVVSMLSGVVFKSDTDLRTYLTSLPPGQRLMIR